MKNQTGCLTWGADCKMAQKYIEIITQSEQVKWDVYMYKYSFYLYIKTNFIYLFI